MIRISFFVSYDDRKLDIVNISMLLPGLSEIYLPMMFRLNGASLLTGFHSIRKITDDQALRMCKGMSMKSMWRHAHF